MLANGAAARDGLLYVEGGGWEWFTVPAFPWTVQGWIAALIELPAGQEPSVVDVRVDGHVEGSLGSMTLSNNSPVLLRAPVAVPFMFVAPEPGPYRVSLSDSDGPMVTLDVDVRLPPPNPR